MRRALQERWPTIRFVRTKYGCELLVDVGWVRDYPTFIQDDRPHGLAFYEVLLITAGRGRVWLDDGCHEVGPGSVVFTLPRQVRRWMVPGLDGICVFFTRDFLAHFFDDAVFVGEVYPFAARGRVLPLDRAEARRVQARLEAMRAEFRDIAADSSGLLRAMLYELLVRLNRAQPRPPRPRLGHAARFVQLVDRHYRRRHRVADYAALLGLTPGHLNDVARRGLGCSAGQVIRARLLVEARRRLLHSGDTAAAIAIDLGFEDPAYFARFFRREAGMSPGAFRASLRDPRKVPEVP